MVGDGGRMPDVFCSEMELAWRVCPGVRDGLDEDDIVRVICEAWEG